MNDSNEEGDEEGDDEDDEEGDEDEGEEDKKKEGKLDEWRTRSTTTEYLQDFLSLKPRKKDRCVILHKAKWRNNPAEGSSGVAIDQGKKQFSSVFPLLKYRNKSLLYLSWIKWRNISRVHLTLTKQRKEDAEDSDTTTMHQLGTRTSKL